MKNFLYAFIGSLLILFVVTSCDKDSSPVESEVPDTSSTDTTSVWDSFAYPEVEFVDTDPAGYGQYYTLYIPDPEQHLKDIALTICRILYKNPEEVPELKKVEFRLEIYEGGVAYTTGLGNVAEKRMVFSTDYLEGLINSRTKQQIIDEITGVIVHEMTHVYQKSCEYADDGWSVIEGVADAMRYLAGADKISRRHTGGSWTDGYTTTGFFIVWLQDNKDPEFLYNLNQYVGKHYRFDWPTAAYALLGVSVESLWEEYQSDIR